jgi:hypothetical protein
MSIQSRISAFYDLGQFFIFFTDSQNNNQLTNSKYEGLVEEFETVLKLAEIHNPWFTQENLQISLEQWGNLLTVEKLEKWVKFYQYTENPKNVGIIMAGNIPMVGFHDLLSVLLTGHNAWVKTSSKDDVLMNWIIKFLQESDEELKSSIQKVEKLQDVDAVIATGSNNTARYFEFYFKNIPHIIRKNRTSVAVLKGDETKEDLENLAKDIFTYFGLGCRNVTKIYLPQNYNTDLLFEAFYEWNPIINHPKYANNYDYNRAIYLMENEKFLDNNFVILRESEDLHSPIGVVHYSFYEDLNATKVQLMEMEEKIQCMVGKDLPVKFGNTQKPALMDYADGIDTMKFLEGL